MFRIVDPHSEEVVILMGTVTLNQNFFAVTLHHYLVIVD
jgi:hypothetical protein